MHPNLMGNKNLRKVIESHPTSPQFSNQRRGCINKILEAEKLLNNRKKLVKYRGCVLKAVILAAGKGERIKPFTEKRPKHLLPVGGKPLLEWILKGLLKEDVNEILLVTHYMEDKIRSQFGDGSDIGLKIRYGIQLFLRG